MATREWYGSELPRWVRALGVFGVERGRRGSMIRCHWAEFSTFRGLGLELSASDGDDHGWHLLLRLFVFQVFIYLPLPRIEIKIGEISRTWGASWFWDSGFGYGDIHCHWDYRCKIIHMPWHRTWVRTSYLLPGKPGHGDPELPEYPEWAHETIWQQPLSRGYGGMRLGGLAPYEFAKWRDLPKWTAQYPYAYRLKSGEVQRVTATVKVEEREWRPWLTMWCPIFRKISRTIAVDFSGEVGERAGSWKGGTVGCGYELLSYYESPLECLRRMERERKF